MSLDLKVYLTDKFDLNDKPVDYVFIDYFPVYRTEPGYTDTYHDIVDNGKLFEEPLDEDENRVFDSYVLSVEEFESDKISKSELKRMIMDNFIYIKNKIIHKFVVIQPFVIFSFILYTTKF